MKKSVSVEKAIKIGRTIKYITFSVIIIIGFGSIFLFKESLIIILCLIFTILSFVFLSNYILAKWRLWAFENVRNVHELKTRALQEYLMYDNSNFMKKMEFRTQKERYKWKEITHKFETEDIFNEKESIPKNLEIRLSKQKIFFGLLGYFSFSIFFIFTLLETHKTSAKIFYGLFLIFCLYQSIKKLLLLFEKKAEIIISNIGIQLKNKQLYKWEYIVNEQIVSSPNNSELYFKFNNEEIIIDIRKLEINLIELKEVIETYRIRYNKTTANNV